MAYLVCKLLHVLAFATYAGGAAAQHALVAAAGREERGGGSGAAFDGLAARFATKAALPGAFVAVAAGLAMLFTGGAGLMKQGWMHPKLLLAVGALVLAHLSMFNARALGRSHAGDGARDGEAAEPGASARRRRHALYAKLELGAIVAIAALAILRPF
jgi:uncharacterized membrane protein